MKVWFRQCYIGVSFPFSHVFQKRMSKELSALVEASPKFLKRYGHEFELTFNVSAKEDLQDNELRGPTVFKKTKDVEYTVFLPFNVIMLRPDAPKVALTFLMKGVCDILSMLEIDNSKVLEKQESLINGICSDPTMLEEPSWSEEVNKTPVRVVFAEFYQKMQNSLDPMRN